MQDSNQSNSKKIGYSLTSSQLSLIIGFILIILFTICGNLLVLCAIGMKRKLRQSVTNCLIASLAGADLLLGTLVMPFSVIEQYRSMYRDSLPANDRPMYILWPFGKDWCDFWHAFDVLSSTASILNLCVISVERYVAISDPINYPIRMTHKRCMFMIAIVWICSAFISFPAIAWWRYSASINRLHIYNNVKNISQTNVTLALLKNDNECLFSTDPIYLFISSCISFYIPLIVMLFVYWKIYVLAKSLCEAFNTGRRIIYRKSMGGEVMILRVHRGGVSHQTNKDSYSNKTNSITRQNSSHVNLLSNKVKIKKKKESGVNNQQFSTSTEPNQATVNNQYTLFCGCFKILIKRPQISESILGRGVNLDTQSDDRSKKHYLMELKRRIQRFTNEKKAAKTLGIVIGVFILCWAPFFICNTIKTVYPMAIVSQESTVFLIVTWLGYINSGINPFIYAYSLKDMRRAFGDILCGLCVATKYSIFRKCLLNNKPVPKLTKSYLSRTDACRKSHYLERTNFVNENTNTSLNDDETDEILCAMTTYNLDDLQSDHIQTDGHMLVDKKPYIKHENN